MYKDNEKDISNGKIDLSLIALQNSKIHIGIIGGGRASLIKAKTFLKNGGKVTIISKEFLEEFNKLPEVNLIKGEYYEDFIKDKHLIVIAIEDREQVLNIVNQCEKNFKLYINSHNGNEGNARISAQRNVGEMIVGVNTLKGNPKGAVFAVERAVSEIEKYKDYIALTSILRKNCKILDEKRSLLKFIGDEEFYFYYIKDKHREILELFYGKDIVKKLYEGS